jgi:hypothetical protein
MKSLVLICAFLSVACVAALASIGDSKGSPCDQVSAAATQVGQPYNATEITSFEAVANKDNVYQVSIENNDERVYLTVEVTVQPAGNSCKVLAAAVTDISS